MPFQTSQNLFCLFFFFNQPISCPTSSYFSGKTVSYRGPLQKPQSILQALYAPLSHTSKILMLMESIIQISIFPKNQPPLLQWAIISGYSIDYSLYSIDRNRSRTFYCVYIQEGYKHHLEKTGDFEGGLYKHHFQNRQFDVSLLENFGKKGLYFYHFFKIFSKIDLQGVKNLF